LFLGWAGCKIYAYPSLLFLVLAIVVLGWVAVLLDRRRWRKVALTRSGESICTFVRAFDWRHTDTWVLRAVYEEFSHHLADADQPIPIRAEDHFFNLDAFDVEELVSAAAIRAGRTMDNTNLNPYFGMVHTVRDLVHFLEHQPRLASAQ
jgi:hypothetical protein